MKGIELALLLSVSIAQRSLTREGNWLDTEIEMFKSVQVDNVPAIKWTLNTKSMYNYDTGYTYMILRHTLVTPIYSDDVIMFGLGFTSATANTDITYDEARCTVEMNTRDDEFWLVTHADGSRLYNS